MAQRNWCMTDTAPTAVAKWRRAFLWKSWLRSAAGCSGRASYRTRRMERGATCCDTKFFESAGHEPGRWSG
jgi:hypothetical protein